MSAYYFLLAQVLTCLLFLAQAPLAAAENSTPAGSRVLPADASIKLQGTVKAVDIEAAESLRQMGEALKKMERAALELMGEATRQTYIAVGDPDVIGTMIIPALPANFMAVGPYLPLRPKWVEYYLDQLGKLIPIYAEMTDTLVMPDNLKSGADRQLEQMRPLFADAREHYIALVDMTKDAKKADNQKVAMYSVIVHDDMQKMDKIRRDVFQLLKESEKKP